MGYGDYCAKTRSGKLFATAYIGIGVTLVASILVGAVAKNLSAAEELSLIHISEPTRRTPISYAVFCLKKKIF